MKRLKVLDLTCNLKQVRDPVIAVECSTCDRKGAFLRAELVKRHGASVTFARLRRMSALGCERLIDPTGDRCATRFPCLDAKVSSGDK